MSHVYRDACRSEDALQPVGTTAADLVAAIDAQAGTDATVTEITHGDEAWTRIGLVESAGIDRTACRHGADGPLQVWADPGESGFSALAPGHRGVVLVTEVAGKRLLMVSAVHGNASEADVAELEAMIS